MKPDKPLSPVTETQATEVKDAARQDQPLLRRSLFGGGLAGLATLVVAACSGSDFAGTAGRGKKKSDENDGSDSDDCDDPSLTAEEAKECKLKNGETDAGDSGDVGGIDSESDASGDGLGDGTDSGGCHANTNSKIDLSGHPEAPEDLKPKIKFYGRDTSAMIALKFTSDKDIGQVIIAKPDGSLIALHGITGADKDAGGKYRPMIIDNINLKDVKDIKIVLQMGADRFVVDAKKEYFTTYESNPVVDLGGGTVPAGMTDNQSMTRFAEKAGSFLEDPTITYPTDGQGARNLQTVKAESEWTKGDTIKGTVTDIMGETIDISGKGLLEYQVFCTYVVSGGKAYRTILQVA